MSNMVAMFIVTMAPLTLTATAMTTALVLAPVVTQELGVSPGLLGAYVSLAAFCSMLLSLVMGGVVRRFGSVRTSQVAVLLAAASMAGAATATAAGLVLSALLIGAAMATTTPAASNLIVRFTPRDRLGTVFSVRQTGVPIGMAVAGAGIPALLLLTGWQNVLIGGALALTATALSFQPLRARLDDDRDAATPIRPASIMRTLGTATRDPVLRGICVSGLGFSVIQGGLLSYLVTYLTLGLGYTLVAAGLVLTASQVAAVVARMFWGWLSDRVGDPLRVLILLSLVSAVICIVLGSITSGWPVALVALAAALFGATAVAWNGVFLGGIARYAPPGETAAVTAGSMAFVFLGSLLGPLMYSLILSLTGQYRAGYLMLALVPLASGLTIVSIRKRIRRAADANRVTV